MLEEAREAPAAVARLLSQGAADYAKFGAELRAKAPTSVVTIARGSSDHAAYFAAYLVMARLGRMVTSLPMSLVTLHQAPIRCEGLAALAFSQSGQSPDLVAPARYFTRGGAMTAAFVNDASSPLAQVVQRVFELHAGAENSVAATKTFIASMVAGARLVASWQVDSALGLALERLPEALERAAAADWSPAVEALVDVERCFVVGRGTGLSVAMEAALKLKETCSIQAEAVSSAELRHGPMAIVESGFPMLVFAPRGPAQEGLFAMAADMRARGATVLLAAPPGTADSQLPLVETAAVDLDPVSIVQSFYPMVDALARARGLDPDKPRHLLKVTRTR